MKSRAAVLQEMIRLANLNGYTSSLEQDRVIFNDKQGIRVADLYRFNQDYTVSEKEYERLTRRLRSPAPEPPEEKK